MAGEKTQQTSSVVKVSIGILAISQVVTIVFCVYLYIQQGHLQQRLLHVKTTEVTDSVTHTDTQSISSPSEDIHLTEQRQKRQATQCGSTYYISRTSTGIYSIRSPNYPQPYPPNTRCNWMFVLAFPEAYGYTGSSSVGLVELEIRFPYPIYIEDSSSCSSDAIEIRGGSDTGPLLASYCGMNRIVVSVRFAGPLHVLFRSDGNAGSVGFSAQVQIAENSGSGAPAQAPIPDPTPTRGSSADVGQPGQSGQSGPMGPQGAPGVPGAAGRDGSTGVPSSQGRNGEPGALGEPTEKGSPGPSSAPVGHTTYVRWGKSRCTEGRLFYDGYAVGTSSGVPQELSCAPLPAQIQSTDMDVTSNIPALAAARFNLIGVSGALPAGIDNQPVRCAFCHAERSTSFVVIGWSDCNANGWVTAYSGYAMTVGTSAYYSAQTICVDRTADVDQGYGVGAVGPRLGFVKSGNGLWIPDKLVPCAVCVKALS